jgi:hypothetical protein
MRCEQPLPSMRLREPRGRASDWLKVPSLSSDSVIIETTCADVYGCRRQRNFGQHVMRQLKSMDPVMNLVFSMDDPSFCGGKTVGVHG